MLKPSKRLFQSLENTASKGLSLWLCVTLCSQNYKTVLGQVKRKLHLFT